MKKLAIVLLVTIASFSLAAIAFAGSVAPGGMAKCNNAKSIKIETASDGDADQFLQTDGSGVMSWATAGGAYTAWAQKTSNFTASAGDQLLCIHASTPFTITLPSSPSANDTVVISNAGAATVTVARNSSNINSTASDHTLVQGTSTQLVYVDSTIGWFEV